jgi:hypothetical protein
MTRQVYAVGADTPGQLDISIHQRDGPRMSAALDDSLGEGFPVGWGEIRLADVHQTQAAGKSVVELRQLGVDADLAGVGDAHDPRQAQGLEDRAVGGQHRCDAHAVGVLPAEGGMDAVVDFAVPGRHLEEMQVDVGVFIYVLPREPRPSDVHLHVELFVELADQGFPRGFTSFDLAARKLPVARVESVGGALAEQKAAIRPGDHRGRYMHDFLHASNRPA